MLRSISRLVAAITLALAGGCRSESAVTAPLALDAEYALETVNGITLPFLKAESASQRVEVVSGSLSLRQNRTYSGTVVEQWTTSDNAQAFPENSAGTYSLSGNQLTFTESGSGAVYHGTLNGTRITATLMDVTFGFLEK